MSKFGKKKTNDHITKKLLEGQTMFYRTFPATAGDLNRTPLRFLILAIST